MWTYVMFHIWIIIYKECRPSNKLIKHKVLTTNNSTTPKRKQEDKAKKQFKQRPVTQFLKIKNSTPIKKTLTVH